MDELQNLEYFSLVNKVCSELDNHLGINDKDLAEFIINMAQESDSYDIFQKKLSENDADFPDSFSSNLYRIIQKMLPNKTKMTTNDNNINETKSEQSRQLTDIALRKAMCPMLARPNDSSVRVSLYNLYLIHICIYTYFYRQCLMMILNLQFQMKKIKK